MDDDEWGGVLLMFVLLAVSAVSMFLQIHDTEQRQHDLDRQVHSLCVQASRESLRLTGHDGLIAACRD